MKLDVFDESYESAIKVIENMKLSEKNKEELLKIVSNLNYEHSRSENYYKLNIEALEEEKQILLNNFIKKDDDANYLYAKVQKYEKKLFNRIIRKIQKIIGRGNI